jgi:hypothetical protein
MQQAKIKATELAETAHQMMEKVINKATELQTRGHQLEQEEIILKQRYQTTPSLRLLPGSER